MAADQPISFSIAEIAGQPAITITIPTTLALRLSELPSTLPVYALAHSPVSRANRARAVQAIAHQLGGDSVVMASAQANPGTANATVRIDGKGYALTLYDGYGAPWYDLRALRPGAGTLSATRTAERATSWLQDHHAGHSGLRVLSVRDGSIDYGQEAAGAPLLGPVALHLSFDGSGALRELHDAYIPTSESESAPALSVNDVNSLDGAITQGQGLYQGPQPRSVTGPAAIQTATLVYVGVRGLHADFLEPVYAVGGIAPTTDGPRPFTIYAIALQYGMPATPTPTSTVAVPVTATPTITATAPITP